MDTDRDEARAVFRAVLTEPPALGFSPADVVRGATRGRRLRVLAAAAAAVLVAAGAGVAVDRTRSTGLPPATPPARTGEAPPEPVPVDATARALQDAAHAKGATVGPAYGGDPGPQPGAAAAESDYSSARGTTYAVRTADGEVGVLWASTSSTSVVGAAAGRAASSCARDASVAGTEDSCRMVDAPDGTRVRLAHHGGTRPREIWTAYVVQPESWLVEVVLSSAAPSGSEPQLSRPLLTDAELAALAARVARGG